MSTSQFLKTRVPSATKRLVHAAATREFLTEATWLRRAIETALVSASSGGVFSGSPMLREQRVEMPVERARIQVRLRAEERVLLRDRAKARGMPAATYASVLLRSHLRQLPPLPKAELTALKLAVGELGAIGRNLNRIARAANSGGRVSGPSREDLKALLTVCEALRDHVKNLLKANLTSWEAGDADRTNQPSER